MRRAIRFWPSALIYRNRINLACAYQTVLMAQLDPSTASVRLTPDPEDLALRRQFASTSPYNLFTPQLLLAVEKSLDKAAVRQVTVALARVACALERYRLANDGYPQRLGELTPRFITELPVDPVDGGSLRYRHEPPGHFVLYSVGLNGRDDGGQPARPAESSDRRRADDDDIVWTSPL